MVPVHFKELLYFFRKANMYNIIRLITIGPKIQFQVSFMLAEMASRVELGRLMTYKSAWMIDQGVRNTYYASIAKVTRFIIINKLSS